MDIPAWLAELELGEYAQLFTQNDIDGSVLPDLTADDLKELGIASIGHRRKILAAIQRLAGPQRSPAAPAQTDPPSETAAERRMLTVMFCDLVDSTALSVGMDPEDFREHIRTFRSAIEEAVQPFRAHIAQYAGDGILAYFGFPHSSDHDAETAVEASLAIVARVRTLAKFGDKVPMTRIGLATGLAVVGGVERSREFRGESAVGETLNLAARLQSLAAPNGIVIAQATRTLIGDMFRCEDLGVHALKGFTEPVQAWEVVARKSTASRFDALRTTNTGQLFVGRRAELAILREARAALPQTGARFFCIVGDAGIGKSRLLREALFENRAHAQEGVILQCSPYQVSSAFYPLRYLIERMSGFSTSDPAEVTLAKLRECLSHAEPCSEERLAVVCELLGVDRPDSSALRGLSPFQKRALTLQHLAGFAVGVLGRHPTLIIEDIQWIDPSTAELLQAVFARIRERPILVAATARPGPSPQWLDTGALVAMQLDRLSPDDTAELVRRILSESAPHGDAVQAIVERCDGIPVFAEELTRGYAAGARDDADELVSNIPATLAESVMARLDRLKDGRRIASIAAAIGREFPSAILVAVSGLPEKTVQSGIRELVDAGIVMPGYSPFGEAICFRQMLIRDAAYQLLLRRDRRTLHLSIVAAMRERFPSIGEAMPHVLALQFFLAGEMAAAADEWLKAGTMASRRSAYGESVKHLRSGLDAIERLPEDEARHKMEVALRTTLIGALIPVEGYHSPAVLAEMERAVAASGKLGSPESIVLALYSKWVVLGSTGNLPAALELALKLRELASTSNEVDKLIAWRACGTTMLFCGRLAEAVVEYNRFMALYDIGRHGDAMRTMHGDLAVMVMLGLAETHALLGNRQEASLWRERVLDAASRSGRVHDHVHILVYAGCLHPHLTGDLDEAARRAGELHALVQEHDVGFWRGHSLLFSGLAKITENRIEEGFSLAEQGVALLLEASVFNNCWYILLARTCIEHGRIEQAERLLGYVKPSMDLGDLRFAPEYFRVLARLSQAQGAAPGVVASHLRRGMELAVAHGSMLFSDQIAMEQTRPASLV